MAASEKNNSLAQQRFANQGNLLSILSQMQASDPNANTLSAAKTRAQINEINAQAARAQASAQHLVSGATTAQTPNINLASVAQNVANMAGIYDTARRLP